MLIRRSLRLRLILSFALVALVTAVSVVLAFRLTSARDVQTFMSGGSMVDVVELTASLEDYYQQTGSWLGVESLLPRTGQGMGNGMMGGQRIRLADTDGLVVADTREETGSYLNLLERSAAVPLNNSDGKVIGQLLVEGGMGGQGGLNSAQLLTRLTRSSLIGALIGTGLALLTALLLAYQLLKPVNQLTHAAALMAKGDLSQRVEAGEGDELSTLGRAFNQMAASLQRAEQNRRAMTADVAHELRTPIAVQRAHLEALQDGVYPLTAENLQPVLDQTELLTRLVDDLRTLALADAGELMLERGSVDLVGMVESLLERFRPEADNHQIGLRFEKPAAVVPAVNVDAKRIEQVLNNLMSNALRYTPGGWEIAIRVEQVEQMVVLRVADSGLGIPEDALGHVFERFYRADKARSRVEGGTGLGLAIARQLVLAHGGELSVRNRPEGGAEFTVELPIHQR
jgi:signal transduction histidine kinase